jgi:hypothetical protein
MNPIASAAAPAATHARFASLSEPLVPTKTVLLTADPMAADPVAARKMGERWPKAALAPFDYRAATREILKVYEEVLGK